MWAIHSWNTGYNFIEMNTKMHRNVSIFYIYGAFVSYANFQIREFFL